MDKLQPIGSVLAIGERRFVVVGHRMTRDGSAVGAGYVVVPYPLGFVGTRSLQVIPAGAAGELVAAGYANAAGDAYLSDFEALADANEGIPYSEYEASERLLRDFARKEVGNG